MTNQEFRSMKSRLNGEYPECGVNSDRFEERMAKRTIRDTKIKASSGMGELASAANQALTGTGWTARVETSRKHAGEIVLSAMCRKVYISRFYVADMTDADAVAYIVSKAK